jgi:hypothetical protein
MNKSRIDKLADAIRGMLGGSDVTVRTATDSEREFVRAAQAGEIEVPEGPPADDRDTEPMLEAAPMTGESPFVDGFSIKNRD